MKNRALLLTLLLPLTLTACNSALLKRAKKILKNANYNFRIDTSTQSNNRSLKRNKVQPKESIYHSDTGMLEIDFDQKVDLRFMDFFEDYNNQLSSLSNWAKQYAYQLVDEVKELQKAKDEGEKVTVPTGIFFNDDTGEVKAFANDNIIHIYYDENNNETVEYSYYLRKEKYYQNVIYNPNSVCTYKSARIQEDGTMFQNVIQMQKINGNWVGLEFYYTDGNMPYIEYGQNGSYHATYQGFNFYFQIGGFDYNLGFVFNWDKSKTSRPKVEDLYPVITGIGNKCGALEYAYEEYEDEFTTSAFLFRGSAYKGISKLFLNTKACEHRFNEKNDGYDFQRFNDDSSYLLTDIGKEIRSAYIFDTQTNQMVDRVNKNTIKCNQTTITAWKGELYEGTYNDYTMGQFDSYVHFGDVDDIEAQRRIQSVLDYFGVSVADYLDVNYLSNLFAIHGDYSKYSDNIFNNFYNCNFNVTNVYQVFQQENDNTRADIERIKKRIY